jgi:hypothetical protein
MKKILISTAVMAIGLTCVHAGEIEDLTKDALINNTSHQLVGTFGKYDFEGVDSAFDWAFTMTNGGKSYQLKGIEPSENDAFGWSPVAIEAPEPLWYMFNIDIDGDGTLGKFEWVLLSVDMQHKAVYKLAGANANGTFAYSKKIDIDYKIDGSTIVTGAVGTLSGDEDSNSLVVNGVDSLKGYKLTSVTYDSGYDKNIIEVEFYCDGTFKQDWTTYQDGAEPFVKTITGDKPGEIYIHEGYYPQVRWVGVDRFDQQAEGHIFFNSDNNTLVVNQSSFNMIDNDDYYLAKIEKVNTCH